MLVSANRLPFWYHHMIPIRPVVRPLGRNLMTVSNSLSICVLAFAFSFTTVCLPRSSFVLAIRSSLVKILLCLEEATASKISSLELLVRVLDRDRGFENPLRACSAFLGLPPTAVLPERLNVGDVGGTLLVVDKDLL